MKTIAKSDGVITFDGVPFVELPIADLLAMASGEASGKGIKVIDARKIVTLHDVTATHDGSPVTFNVSLRVERSPKNQNETDLVNRTAAKAENGRVLRDAKTRAGEDRLINAVTQTAINVAQQTQRGNDPITSAVVASITQRLGLPSGDGK